MNKWFESKNIANYAKTALLQAQKKIDQVLDIKEDEIIAASNYSSSSSPVIDTSANVEHAEGSKLTKSASNTSLASNHSSKVNEKKEQADTDSFFSTFLPSIIQTPAADAAPSTSSMTGEQQVQDTNINTNSSASLKPKKSSTTSSNNKRASKSSLKSNNISITQATSNSETDKQNWIQNYVDSSPTQSTFLNQDQKSTTLTIPSTLEQQNSQTNTSLTSSSLLISSSSQSSTSTANAALVLLSSSTSSSSSTATNSAGFSLANNDTINEVVNEECFREDSSMLSLTPTQLQLNENQNAGVSDKQQITDEQIEVGEANLEKFEDVSVENLNNVKSFTESLDYVSQFH